MKALITAPIVEVEPDPEAYPGETVRQPKGVDAAPVKFVAWYPPRSAGANTRCVALLKGKPTAIDAVVAEDMVRQPDNPLVERLLAELTGLDLSAEEIHNRNDVYVEGL